MKKSITGVFIFLIVTAFAFLNCQSLNDEKKLWEVPETDVSFETTNITLQRIFDKAEEMAEANIVYFGERKIMCAGWGGRKSLWLETQPIDGYMYAKRDLEVAGNNIRIFMDLQRNDGRMPGMVTYDDSRFFAGIEYNVENTKLNPIYGWFQGYFFPRPAFELYFWLKKDMTYLSQLYDVLEKFDNYLWSKRDSDNDGCLETWCIYDTGEDNCIRFYQSPSSWPYEYPPRKEKMMEMSEKELTENCYKYDAVKFNKATFGSSGVVNMPFESMDAMSYSYSGRDILSLISKELGNGKEAYWREKANEVREKIRDYLWDEKRHACYDRDKSNNIMDVLCHNNIRCMWFGSFDQQMADDFIRYHLLNPEEFWTPMPLPSIAANDPLFQNVAGNNWSGQPHVNTYQRSIGALENYGHYAELSLIGKKFLKILGESLQFTPHYDTYTCIPSTDHNGYSTSILTSLELISRMYGVHITHDRIYWSCMDNENDYHYSQKWDDQLFTMSTEGNQVMCSINNKNVYSFTKGVRIVSDIKGNIHEVVGIETDTKNIDINYKFKTYKLKIGPNEVFGFDGKFKKLRSIEFCNPG
jgi:hypothetical protein